MMNKKKILCLTLVFMGLFLFSGAADNRIYLEKELPVPALIRTLEVGKSVSYGHLTIIPVFMDTIRDKTDYVTLGEALERQWIEIVELDGGRVPQVKISNLSRSNIYIMGGEILTGCKQDRIMARDLLLGVGTKNLIAPVFCVEHGRWDQSSSRFFSKENVGTYSLRATAHARNEGAQSEIWAKVAEQNRKIHVESPTSAYQDAFDKKENREKIALIEREMAGVPRLYKDTVGVVIGLGSEIIGADIFANPGLFQKQWPKILRSSALSSLAVERRGGITQKDAVRFLRSFSSKRFRMEKGLDLGMEYGSADSDVFISSLAYKQGVIHLAAFPQEGERIKVWEDSLRRERVIRDDNLNLSPEGHEIRFRNMDVDSRSVSKKWF